MRKGEKPVGNRLWTRDFTIITLGSVVSMLGNSLSGFGMSLLVLDYTGSSFLYAVYVAAFTLPQLLVPIFGGAILDRFSRKKAIYTLDFVSAGMYCLLAAILFLKWFNFPVLAIFCFFLGIIQSLYIVAYESFYPLLISDGNYKNAYSVASILETLTALAIPLASLMYNGVGIAPLMCMNAGFFLVAAIMETQIKAEEKYVEKQREDLEKERRQGRNLTAPGTFLRDVKQGFAYLWKEKGLLCIAIYFAFSSFSSGASNAITLPFFKDNFADGEYVYSLVWGLSVVGRMIGGFIHYRWNIPTEYKYGIALTVYITISFMEGMYLFTESIPAMTTMLFIAGFGGVTSYTIRISATQSYVPDEKKGRFNGAFSVLSTGGSFAGELLAGALGLLMPAKYVLLAFMSLNVLAAVFVIGGGKKYVEPIYNSQH